MIAVPGHNQQCGTSLHQESSDVYRITPTCKNHSTDPPTKGNRERYANTILPTLTDPLEVWLAETERLTPTGEKQPIFRRRFIALFGDNKDKQGLVVVEEGKDESLLWTFVPMSRPSSLDKRRSGFLLYRKESGQ